MIDEVLGRRPGAFGNGFGGLPLGAHEEHASAHGDHIGDRDQRLVSNGTDWVRSIMWILLREP